MYFKIFINKRWSERFAGSRRRFLQRFLRCMMFGISGYGKSDIFLQLKIRRSMFISRSPIPKTENPDLKPPPNTY